MNNFDELASLITDYGKRPRLLDRVKQTFIPLANIRIGRDLRSKANEAVVELDGEALGNPMPLPLDYAAPSALVWKAARGDVVLDSRDAELINNIPDQGNPFAYNIRGGNIYVKPFVSGKYELTYYQVPVLDEDNQTNAVLTSHPQLYLYGALVELYVWTMDAAHRDEALNFYQSEVKLINRDESRSRAASLASVGR